MSQIIVDIPDDSLAALNMSPDAASLEIRLAAATKLFELGKLSSGAAAHLAGLPRTVFLSRLADFGVDTFRMSAEDIESETPLA